MDNPIPELGAPARRALANAGLTSLEDVSRVSEAELLALHGFGPSSLPVVHRALEAAGLAPRPSTNG